MKYFSFDLMASNLLQLNIFRNLMWDYHKNEYKFGTGSKNRYAFIHLLNRGNQILENFVIFVYSI